MAKSKARSNTKQRNREHTHAMSSEAVREIHELRRSNASGTHADRRTKRQRSRSAQKRAAINHGW